MSSVLALISWVLTTWHSKRLHLLRSSCWTLLQHPPCFHIWNTCQQGYCSQKRQTHNPLSTICLWTHLPSSRAPKLVYKHPGPPQKWEGINITMVELGCWKRKRHWKVSKMDLDDSKFNKCKAWVLLTNFFFWST
jgi:hypothetical protein